MDANLVLTSVIPFLSLSNPVTALLTAISNSTALTIITTSLLSVPAITFLFVPLVSRSCKLCIWVTPSPAFCGPINMNSVPL